MTFESGPTTSIRTGVQMLSAARAWTSPVSRTLLPTCSTFSAFASGWRRTRMTTLGANILCGGFAVRRFRP